MFVFFLQLWIVKSRRADRRAHRGPRTLPQSLLPCSTWVPLALRGDEVVGEPQVEPQRAPQVGGQEVEQVGVREAQHVLEATLAACLPAFSAEVPHSWPQSSDPRRREASFLRLAVTMASRRRASASPLASPSASHRVARHSGGPTVDRPTVLP